MACIIHSQWPLSYPISCLYRTLVSLCCFDVLMKKFNWHWHLRNKITNHLLSFHEKQSFLNGGTPVIWITINIRSVPLPNADQSWKFQFAQVMITTITMLTLRSLKKIMNPGIKLDHHQVTLNKTRTSYRIDIFEVTMSHMFTVVHLDYRSSQALVSLTL